MDRQTDIINHICQPGENYYSFCWKGMGTQNSGGGNSMDSYCFYNNIIIIMVN